MTTRLGTLQSNPTPHRLHGCFPSASMHIPRHHLASAFTWPPHVKIASARARYSNSQDIKQRTTSPYLHLHSVCKSHYDDIRSPIPSFRQPNILWFLPKNRTPRHLYHPQYLHQNQHSFKPLTHLVLCRRFKPAPATVPLSVKPLIYKIDKNQAPVALLAIYPT